MATYFDPTKKIMCIVHNRNYEIKRDMPGFGGFADIKEVDEDAENVRQGLSRLGCNQMDIHEIKDATRDDLSKLFKSLNSDLRNFDI